MELFRRRYLCLISFMFLLSALLMTLLNGSTKLMVGIAAFVGMIAAIVLTVTLKKQRFTSLLLGALCLSISVSAFSSYFFISRAENKADSLLGKNTVWVRVVNQSGDGEYAVKLLRVGDEYVDIKAELSFEYEKDLEYGDELIFNAAIERATDVRDRSKLISLAVIEEDRVFVKEPDSKNYFSADGIASLCHDLQEGFSDHVDKVFGDHAPIAKGLLVNDTRDIDERTQTAFKRSGTSHILAVSGMHISLLMGALEMLLRTLRVRKGVRIAVVSLSALLFLALTAFAASAVRSVIMLYAVYLCYILYEENDAQTSLFISISLIVLFSPFSVYDLGMWMSFLATLGLLVVYPQFSDRLPYPKQDNLFIRYSLRALLWCLKTLMLTIVANFFLLPIMWCFFGSVSISTLPCNLLLAPIVTVLMPICAVAAIVGIIPYVGVPFVFVANKLIDLMMAIVNYFAEMRYGVLSLRFEFAGILVILFTLVFVVMLVIRLKHKLFIFAPMMGFVIAFAICFSIFNAISKPELNYVRSRNAELLFLSNGAECSVVDMGEADSLKGNIVVHNMSKYATEIDEYVILDPDEKDAKTIENVCKNTVVRKILIPKTIENQDLLIYKEILLCAEKYNIEVVIFEFEKEVALDDKVRFSYNSDGTIFLGSDNAYLLGTGDTLSYTYGNRTSYIPNAEYIEQRLPLE